MPETPPVVVIGSGLSGISAAVASLAAGASVLMLDAGLTLPDSTREEMAALADLPPWRWDAAGTAAIQAKTETTTGGVKEKKLFGSDFASRSLEHWPQELREARFYSSFARNGLGNIWGCGLLPMRADDMGDWPIALADLEEDYRAVLRFMPLAGRRDSLEALLPLYCAPRPHALSSQGSALLARMEKKRAALEERGVFFGASRLAGSFAGENGREGCRQCGMCMYGCPYGVLYSGGTTLRDLETDPRFTYRSGVVVHKLEQEAGVVRVYAADLQGRNLEPLTAGRVLLCAGTPASTRIMLLSLGLIGRPVRIKTSEQCYMPLLVRDANPCLEHEAMHTMCQAYWLLNGPEGRGNCVHLSLYGYNDLYAKALAGLFGRMQGPLLPLAGIFLRRLFFAFCYLHSDLSADLIAEIRDDAAATLRITGNPNHESRKAFAAVHKKLRSVRGLTGLSPLPLYKGTKPPGGGNHFGGSFPMARDPHGLQTDIWGRVAGLDRVHVADASCFPSITATTITLSVMANAHRIARHAAAMP